MYHIELVLVILILKMIPRIKKEERRRVRVSSFSVSECDVVYNYEAQENMHEVDELRAMKSCLKAS